MTDRLSRTKRRASRRLRRRALDSLLSVRTVTAGVRRLPDVLVLGTQRGGTSSLYKYLGAHPDVAPSLKKETEFFSRHYANGVDWYRANFPLVGRRRLAFEATPDYLFYPSTPDRVAELLPDASFIVLLRDPVERAWSHYRQGVLRGFESLPLHDAIELEPRRTSSDPTSLLRYSYVTRGRYAEQLERWFDRFPRERFLIVWSDDLYRQTAATYERILDFLHLPAWAPTEFRNFSYAEGTRPDGTDVPTAVRQALERSFADPDARLRELLGHDLRWDR
jgi:hypothetical protein